MSRWLPLVLAVIAAGCVDDFDPPSLITKTRPLGVRVTVEGAPGRAWPLPGENVTLEWLMVGPAEPRPLTWALIACPGVVAPTGDTFCAAEPIGFALQDAPTTVGAPTIAFAVPPTAALGEIDRILVTGVVCADGTTRVDLEAMDVGCDGADAVTSLVSAGLRIAADEPGANRHPTISADAISIAEQPWTTAPTDIPPPGCRATAGGSALPLVTVGDKPEIRITAPETDRELFEGFDGQTREALVFSHYSTAGELERQFSAIDELASDVRVEWDTPLAEDVPADGVTVDFHFIERDGRGGIDFTMRTLCVVP